MKVVGLSWIPDYDVWFTNFYMQLARKEFVNYLICLPNAVAERLASLFHIPEVQGTNLDTGAGCRN